MRVLLVPASQNPTYQTLNSYPTAQIQKVQLLPSLLSQNPPGCTVEDYEDYVDYGNYGEQTEAEDHTHMYDFNQLDLNKNDHDYDNLSLPSQTHTSKLSNSPTVNAIPTRTIKKFTFLNKGKQSVLAIDSGYFGLRSSQIGTQNYPIGGN